MSNVLAVQGTPYVACLVMLAILSYVGIHVLKREIIFIDIALAQIAAVGAIAAHVVFHFHGDSFAAQLVALGATLAAAAFFAVIRRRVREIPLEAIIGVTYAIAAAAALFLVGIAPGGHVHVQSMLSGSILWADPIEVLVSAAILAAVALVFFVFRRRFQTISDDYEEALARGVHTTGWDFLFYALVSIVITTVVRIGGVVVVFSFLVMPVTTATLVSRGWTARLLISWLFGALAAAVGLLFADRFDFSVGPAIALGLGATLVLCALLRRVGLSRGWTLGVATVSLLVVGLGLGVGNQALSAGGAIPTSGGSAEELAPSPGYGGAAESDEDPGSARGTEEASGPALSAEEPAGGASMSADEETAAEALDETTLASIDDAERLKVMYRRCTDAHERSLVILRLLEVDPDEGVPLALDFLSADPPLLFRAMVVSALDAATGVESGYDAGGAWSAAANRSAVARWQEAMQKR